MSELLRVLIEQKIVAIMRGTAPQHIDATADALVDGGIRLLEVTLNTQNALQAITRWRERYAGRACIGAGTVLDVEMAQQSLDAGAQFLISPNFDEDVVKLGTNNGVDVWPGVMTPTEMVRAWKAGANAVKVFPSATLGPNYFKEVRGPLSQIPLIATGGINLENMTEFLRTGAVAVGVGGSLVDKKLIDDGRFDELTELTRRYVAASQAVQS
ncbi:MAG TPA: bifunctional 4-hydroxy-2-oxoglutarate aldolase/2-dehydro-3-deoxy-phosphogluconate aldolase [Abditibacteriaceae bacterium]|jgi:2-dehydro-3-deoxyphosphogluconate aldolase/(4S)-4-hydroxy-2-oxoglutarate aldolase